MYVVILYAGNMSILPYYFTPASPTLRVDDSLLVTLQLTSFGTVWEFHISGRIIMHINAGRMRVVESIEILNNY